MSNTPVVRVPTRAPMKPTGDPDVDSWMSPAFAPLDLTEGGAQMTDKLVEGATAEQKAALDAAEAGLNQPPAAVSTTEPQATQPAAPAPEVSTEEFPEVYEFEDGSKIVIDQTTNGLKATLSIGEGGDQVFHGRDREEIFQQVLVAQLNATKKIRQQNRELKTRVTASSQPVAIAAKPAVRELTTDEKFAIKNLMADDPEAALLKLIELKTGQSLNDLAASANEGKRASVQLYCDTEARAFLEDHPRYVAHNENYMMLIGYLAKSKLGIELTPNNWAQVMYLLPERGFFSRQTLDEAYQVLTQDGLLELAPEEEEVPPEPAPTPVPTAPVQPVQAAPAAPAAPAPAASTPAGIPQGARPRATSIAFGVTPSSTVPGETTGDKVPSADELDALPTNEINDLFAAVRRAKADQLRRK